jgi:hypothetical protein
MPSSLLPMLPSLARLIRIAMLEILEAVIKLTYSIHVFNDSVL